MKRVFNNDTLDYMYRYIVKFVGTYRVKAELDSDTQDFPRDDKGQIDASFEDLYIPCSRGVIKHTYMGNDILAVCFYDKATTAKNVYKELKNKYPKLDVELDIDGVDGFIYFNAEDIKKVATIIKPRTSGAKIDPFSNKNLPKIEYRIPSKEMTELYDLTKDLSKVETMQFYKKVNTDFIKGVRKLNGEKYDAKAELKKSRLGTREFIHSVGLWDKYIKYVKKELKSI